MTTKSVTLKDSNGDTLYPVTDSNVVNINQQKTLAQALDGVVYAEDPTQNATPTAWVTSDDLATPKIVAAGTISVGSVGANTEKRGIVAIPTQDDTDYAVIYSHAADVSGYDHCVPTTRTANKTTSQFQWNVYNSGSASGNLVLGYVVVKY